LWIGLALASLAAAQNEGSQPPKDAGPSIGARIPDFEAIDQNGTSRRLASIAGPKGAVLIFYRSADW
jgi:cytochrome oxidase Cu insertion factor (SCO1/SenC/PrrC family)